MITVPRVIPGAAMPALEIALKTASGGAVFGLSGKSDGTTGYTVIHADGLAPEIENELLQIALTWDTSQRTAEQTHAENLLKKIRTLANDVGTTQTAITAAADLAALRAALLTLAQQVETLAKYVKRIGD